MLQELYISNFVLIDEVTITLCGNLNVFSGATGVGKSLIIGALNFILGGRISVDVIRSGKNEATVIGKFYIRQKELIKRFQNLLDNKDIDEEIVLQRTLDANKRNRCRFNNIPISLSTFKEIGELLVTIHGQHEHEALLHGMNQLSILDDFGGISQSREAFLELQRKTNQKQKYRDILKDNAYERKQKVELYAFQVDEIDKAQLKEGELEELERERNVLVNAEKIYQAVSFCYLQLYESPDAIVDKLKTVSRELQSVVEFDDDLQKTYEVCNQTLYQAEDMAFSLGKFKEQFQFDQQQLEYVEERLNTIRKLRSKYGNTIEEILSYRNDLAQKLNQLTEDDSTVEQLEKEIAVLTEQLKKQGRELARKRKTTAEKLSPLIDHELHDLGIPHGKFRVRISSPYLNDNKDPNDYSADNSGPAQVEFLISPNPGEKLKPLKKIASGGEISRVMLALKHQLAKVDKTPVLVFDEIDANIGGRMGEVIGKKLRSIAGSHQVICITHLPQIASYADEQWKVSKIVKDGKTSSTIESLKGETRLEEIADMIRGSEKTDITRKQAQEMLRDAKKSQKARPRNARRYDKKPQNNPQIK